MIADPACGTGGFFLASYDFITNPENFSLDKAQKAYLKDETFHGNEIVANTRRLCLMNMFLHNIGEIDGEVMISPNDSLVADTGQRFDYVLANPPFGKKSSMSFTNEEGEQVKVTGMPAIHTTDEEIRPVIGETMGFLLEWEGQQNGAFYLSGDTVWIDDIEEIGRRYNIGTGILNMGAANVPAVGDRRLTMNGEEGAKVAKTLSLKTVYPAHFEGWLHYKEGIEGIKQAFAAANLKDVLEILKAGQSAQSVI